MSKCGTCFPDKGEGGLIRVLSIDGGGVKGLIPGVMLKFLEARLQELDGEDVRLADYFDVVTGTSTGGLIASMITTPNNKKRPLYAAKDIVPFYREHCPKIFPRKNNWWLTDHLSDNQCKAYGALDPLMKIGGWFTDKIDFVKVMMGPKYDGIYLRTLLKGCLKGKKLHETLVPLVIPAFDIKRLQPVIFSTYEAQRDVLKDPLLSDVCISTSAAPIYLPPHHFKTSDAEGKKPMEFNLIDGGVAANNPTMIAMSTIIRERLMKKQNCGRFLVISLGTGSAQEESKFDAHMASKWGMFKWLSHGDSAPLLDAFAQASADVVDIHASIVFQALLSEENYLRIELGNLTGTTSSVDISTEKNMQDLIRIGKELLKKPMSRVNLETGTYDEVKGKGTNAEALTRFAKKLSCERSSRETISQDSS